MTHQRPHAPSHPGHDRGSFTAKLTHEAAGAPEVGFIPDYGIKIPVDVALSGTMSANGANLAGTFSGQVWCLSGAPIVTGTIAVTHTPGVESTMTLKFLSISNAPLDNQLLVGCEYTGPGVGHRRFTLHVSP